jgi:hypothetical protein
MELEQPQGSFTDVGRPHLQEPETESGESYEWGAPSPVKAGIQLCFNSFVVVVVCSTRLEGHVLQKR